MKTYKHLFEKLCSGDSIEAAYWNARRHKSQNACVQEFEKNWQHNLHVLLEELRTKTYRPRQLKTFILRDPKTRRICVSDFRDRIVHHALVSTLQPIFEPRFIHDSYASRKGKGTLAALKRFDTFMRKVTRNGKRMARARNANAVQGFCLKADIKHYFETVDHEVLLKIVGRYVKDQNLLWLVKTILDNGGNAMKGMPLGNWTSQFFANVYLNELDWFVKHTLKARCYIRYVDDFVILHRSKRVLEEYQQKIRFCLQDLKLELHPHKCSIIPLSQGVSFLGFRVFYHHKLVRKRNARKIRQRLSRLLDDYRSKIASAWDVLDALQGWSAYAMHGNTYRFRQHLTQEVKAALSRT